MSVRLVRVALVLYALLVAGLMLWPAIRGPELDIPRPDLLAHFGVYALLTSLLIASRLFSPVLLGARNVLLSTAGVLVYATLLECGQAIPALGRTFAADDALANATGVFGVACGALLLGAIDEPSRTVASG